MRSVKMSTVESKVETAVAATPVKKSAKKSVKKVAKKASKKSSKKTAKKVAKKAAPAVSPDEKPIRWSERKLALLKALVKGRATSSVAAINKEKIVNISNGKALTNLNPNFDITVQGYIAQSRFEDSREAYYYITKKGLGVLKDNG
jgi:hypothetical protein